MSIGKVFAVGAIFGTLATAIAMFFGVWLVGLPSPKLEQVSQKKILGNISQELYSPSENVKCLVVKNRSGGSVAVDCWEVK